MYHLNFELAKTDPWLLDSNQYEQKRFKTMLNLLEIPDKYKNTLDIPPRSAQTGVKMFALREGLHITHNDLERIRGCSSKDQYAAKALYGTLDKDIEQFLINQSYP